VAAQDGLMASFERLSICRRHWVDDDDIAGVVEEVEGHERR